ncbi:unnamed protein product, partial [Laminaria digitata]
MHHSSSLSSPIEGFVVQKWMRDRTRATAPHATAGVTSQVTADLHADLQLIFRHLDTHGRGKISLHAIRKAIGMVALSDDPARHAHLSDRIIASFHAPSDPSMRPETTVNFGRFVAVMCSQGQGRAFLTLQDELKSEGLSAATSLFANIFCREIVVKELLSRGGGDMRVCSTFKELFKGVGLSQSPDDRIRKLRRQDGALNTRQERPVEGERAALARKALRDRS